MTGRVYTNPQQFRHALDQMLKNRHGGDLSRVRQLLVFERLLARLVAEFDDAVILKGGLALELRLTRARTTKDVDIRFSAPARPTQFARQRPVGHGIDVHN